MESPETIARRIILEENTALVPENAEYLIRRIAEAFKEEWTCGHVAGAMCAECYHNLAQRAHELTVENFLLREALRRTK